MLKKIRTGLEHVRRHVGRTARVFAPATQKLTFRLAIATAGAAACAVPAFAQAIDCRALQAQIARAGQASASGAGRYLAAANRQRSEIDRTAAYARSIGCGQRQFLFFGSPPPPQCGPLEARLSAMRANLGNLQAQVQMASGGNRAELVARYNAYCTQQAAVQQPRSFFDQLFGGPQQYERMPIPDDGAPIDPDADENRSRGGGSTAICVRTCDGGFFPVSYSIGGRDLDSFADLCKALCPNADTAVYRYTNGGDINDAVSSSGASYTELKNAGKFRKTFDPTCTCKPANKSWSEVLDQAESLLGSKSKDMIVTPEKAEELSRPKATPVRQTRAGTPAATPAVAQPAAADIEKSDAATGEQAPTAGGQSAGITGGNATASKAYGVADGVKVEAQGPKGVKRKVRIVGPTL
ncbi:DUF2865 domain-containing protein [Roseiarcaceae bacterium H3SJ34-1]|uniref:DUF2865 domain-containing protein n=1 Tax=Terripilifer ovatus TaxID=3032367 RepID=UPI003AB96201|nr:DUF2865 domain-containing protein [Roseiarcaceae bacterium H3SJ34-1]